MRRAIVFSCFLFLLLVNTFPVWGEDDGTVTISLDKYAALQKLAGGAYSRNNTPPADYFVSSTHYTLRCDSEKTVLACQIELVILRNAWIQVPLFEQELPLRSSRLNDAPAQVMVHEGKYTLYLCKPGAHKVDLEFSLESFQRAPALTFTLIASAIPTLTVDSSLKNLDISVSPGSLMDQSSSEKGISRHYVLPHEGVMKIMARTKQEPGKGRRGAPAVINGDLHHVLLLGEALLICETQAHLQILNSPVKELALRVPEGAEIISVEGEHLVNQRREGRRLILSFNTLLYGDYLLKIKTEKKLRGVSDSFTYEPVKLVGAHREKGYMALAARTNVNVTVSQPYKATMIDVTELPPELVSSVSFPILSGYKYLKPDCSLGIEVKRYQDVPVIGAAVDSAEVLTVKSEEGICISKAVYHIKNNMKQHLSVTLPPGSELWSVFVANRSEKPGKDDKGTILIPLQKSNSQEGTIESFPVELVYVSRGKGVGVMGLPSFQLPQIDLPISSLDFSLYLPDSIYVLRTFGMKCIDMGESDSKAVTEKMLYSNPLAQNFLRARAQGQMTASRSNQKNQGGAIDLYDADMGKSMQAGILPVSVTIPARGRSLHFERLMVTSGAPSLRIAYVPRKFINDSVIILSIVIFLSALFYFMKRTLALSSRLAVFRFSGTADVPPSVSLFGKILFLMIIVFLFVVPWSLVCAGSAVLLGLILAKISRRKLKPAGC